MKNCGSSVKANEVSPLLAKNVNGQKAKSGFDPIFGLEPNWKELDQFLTHAHYQGLTNNKSNPEALFDNTAEITDSKRNWFDVKFCGPFRPDINRVD
jgi:hypothetical protein